MPLHHLLGKERIFDGYPDVAFDLVDKRTFDGRLQLLEYVPTVFDAPTVRLVAGGDPLLEHAGGARASERVSHRGGRRSVHTRGRRLSR
jgi:hypothetical protein